MDRLHHIQERLAPHRAALLDHPIYGEIDRLSSLRIFMEHHVFAVWDFMSLLKALQKGLCCVDVPWLPPLDQSASRMINEIVLAEESDKDGQGGYASHFDLYHRSMLRCGANCSAIDTFLDELRHGESVSLALQTAEVPPCARRFVRQTFRVIESGNLCAIAAAFTFGREDLLPAVFRLIVDRLNVEADGRLEDFKYYLERHIDLDGEQHGPMANNLLISLCGGDEANWQLAEQTAVACLEARLELWNGIRDANQQRNRLAAG